MKKYVNNLLTEYLDQNTEEILNLLETPPNREMGDVAFPCFSLAKSFRKAPQAVAVELAEKITDSLVVAKAVGPYLNFYFNRSQFAAKLL